jgi:hypothetical protein
MLLLVICSRQVNATAGSFHARQSPNLGIIERIRFTLAKSVSTEEARATCLAAVAAGRPVAQPSVIAFRTAALPGSPPPEVTGPEVTSPNVTTPDATSPNVTTPEVVPPEALAPQGPPPEVAGEWRLVNNSQGRHVLLRVVALVVVQP